VSEAGFQRCLAVAWLPQNDGQPLHTTSGDPGGATNWGVTYALFAAWRLAHHMPYPSVSDFAAATKDEMANIIRAWIWLPVHGDSLPVGPDLMLFEMALMSGPGTAARVLQGVLGVPADGAIGDITLAAVGAYKPIVLIELLTTAYLRHVNGLSTAPLFGDGWDRRIEADEATAQSWITNAAGSVAT
jgi:lysozyme family protein